MILEKKIVTHSGEKVIFRVGDRVMTLPGTRDHRDHFLGIIAQIIKREYDGKYVAHMNCIVPWSDFYINRQVPIYLEYLQKCAVQSIL